MIALLMLHKTQKLQHTVVVDTGTIIMIDPGYLFSKRAWKEIAEYAYPKKKTPKTAAVEGSQLSSCGERRRT